ncbi:MAG: hypothetical protein WBB37_04130 [bacterium]
MKKEALAAANYISQRTKIRPRIGLTLGAGLSALTKIVTEVVKEL